MSGAHASASIEFVGDDRPRRVRPTAMKLYRFRYSPYARKVQILLDLSRTKYDLIEVPYGDRTELATLTGGYIHVPVLLDDDGKVVVESRAICEHLLAGELGARLVPSPWEGPIWAYHDFCDGALEDVTFRIASPGVRDRWQTPNERALYVLIKERKFGAGCVDAWQREQPQLIAKAQALLAPSLRTLKARPFLFGEHPTLADASLYGVCAMITEAEPGMLDRVASSLTAFMRRLESYTPG
jgi:glutathione S-transferase